MSNLESMTYTNEGGSSPQLKVLDQLLVPHEKVYLDVPDVEMAYTVIKAMQIRGMCVNVYPLSIIFLALFVDHRSGYFVVGPIDSIEWYGF